MPTITQIVAQIRTAIYGKDVRENIAQGIEKCYQDSTANAQIQAIIAKGQETLNSIPENYTELSEEVDDLKSALFNQFGPNYQAFLTKGNGANTYGPYMPMEFNKFDIIYVTTKDESNFVDVNIEFYNENKEYIDYWALKASYGKSRTITYPNNTTAYFVRIKTIDNTSPENYVVTNLSNPYYMKIRDIPEIRESLENTKKGTENSILGSSLGIFVNSETGEIGNAENYSAAKDTNNNIRMPIPSGCIRIVFNNINLIREGVAGWAIYDSVEGSAAEHFVRGGKTQAIDIQQGDKVFAVSSFINSDSTHVTNFSITFVYENAAERINYIADNSIQSITKETTPHKYIDYRDGSVHSFSGAGYSILVNELIPKNVTKITFPETVFITQGIAGWAVYDSNGEYLDGGQNNYINVEPEYASFGLTVSGDPAPSSAKYNFIYGKINEEIYELQRLANENTEILNNGCKIVMLGDSIVGNFDGVGSIPYYLKKYTKAECYNCAIGGSSLGSDLENPDSFFEAFNGWKMIHAIATNNYSIMQDAIDNNPSRATYHQNHIDILKNMDWSTVDVITLSYGTNDWGTKVILDDPNNPKSTDTFTGALRTALEELWSVYPEIKVMVCGVVWRGIEIIEGEITADTDNGKWGRNWYLYEYEEKAKEVCEEYHVQFVPMYNYTGFNKHTWSVYFPPTDGTHPNAIGRKVMAKRYATHLIELTANE